MVGEKVEDASARMPISAASFDRAYAEMGEQRDPSFEIRVGAEPYTLQLEAKTNRLTPARFARRANSTAAAPFDLTAESARKSQAASLEMAARWTTAS
jgi:hypothetical protein